MMIIEAIETLLKEAMGLDAVSIGSAAIQRAVRARLAACNLTDIHTYWERVHASETELQELIEAVVVPETWFFRDRGAFEALVRLAREDWPRNRPEGTIRLLSLPCSTGEEPYSMVMALADAAFPMQRLQVDAVDISRLALAHAQLGIYTRNSFRGADLDFRDCHFEAVPKGYRLADALRKPVRFLHGNLIDTGFLPGMEIYDVIFCRNLLIYFDRVTQDRVVGVLTRLLTANGVLFVGPSEAGLLLTHNFVSVRMPVTFAFRKAGAVPPAARQSNAAPLKPTRPRQSAPPAARALGSNHQGKQRMPVESVTVSQDPLGEAERLANQGDLVAAMECCERQVRDHGPSAKAYSLMGLVHDAAGREPEALDQYRRALYLEPAHHETLIHLALLLEKRGDKASAQVLHARARRTKAGATE